MGAAVAEVDHHEVWQRSRLTLSVVTREYREVERLLDEAERYLAAPGMGARTRCRGRWWIPMSSPRPDAPRRTRASGRCCRSGSASSKDPRIGFVTVTGVARPPDLKQATVYVSVLGNERKRERDARRRSQAAHGVLQARIGARAQDEADPAAGVRIRSVGRARRPHDQADRRARPGRHPDDADDD